MSDFKFNEYYKSMMDVGIEAIVVGLMSLILFTIIFWILYNIKFIKQNHNIHMALSIFLSGSLFHLLCEYSGINVWYCKNYCKMIV